MKMKFKKLLAGILSAVMLTSSFSVFATDDNTDTLYHSGTKSEIPIEVITENSDDILIPELTPEPDNTDDETSLEATPEPDNKLESEETTAPDLSVWDIPEPEIQLFASTTTVASGKCGANLNWKLDSAGTLTISGTGKMYDYSDTYNADITTAPWGKYANKFKQLVLNKGITSIGHSAFQGCSGLTGELIIPDSVTSIECSAFYGCSGFDGNLIIPDSVTSIASSAFQGCSGFDGNLIIPDSVTSINGCAFYGCSGLTGKLIIPDSVTSIGGYTFHNCMGLTGNLIIPDSVTTIGNGAFSNCRGLTGNLIIPDSVTSIGSSAFSGCSNITDMYIPRIEDSVRTDGYPNRVHWKYDLSKCTATIKDYTCTGTAIVPTEADITVTSPNGKTLYYGTDYVITDANNNIAVGTATAHIEPPEDSISILSQDVPFNIVGIDLSGATVTFPENITYQGEPCKPEPTVVVNGKTLIKDNDYSISYSNNNGESTGKAVINGIGNYLGSVKTEFEIKPYKPDSGYGYVDISKNIVEATIDGTFVFNGTAHTPKPRLVYHFTNPTTGITIDYDMVEGTDYEIVSHTNNVNAGTATITIAGIGTFENERDIDFTITPCKLSETIIADIPSYEYCKKDICPDPEVKIGDIVLTKDVDYILEYENNRNRGTAAVIIKGKGNLSGTATKNFEITPRDGTKFTIIIWL